MEFTIHHRLETMLAFYEALLKERYGNARTVSLIVALAAMVALVLALPWPWVWSALLGGSAVALAGLGMVRDAVRKQVREQYELVGAASLRYRIEDDGLFEVSRLGESRMRWHAFAPPRELAGHLVLARLPLDAGAIIALPLDQIDSAQRQALEDHVKRATQPPMG
jgi:hypothetical protein